MECFAKIVFAKSSVLDVWRGAEYVFESELEVTCLNLENHLRILMLFLDLAIH